MTKRRPILRGAFALIEILVVIAVLCIVAAIAMPRYLGGKTADGKTVVKRRKRPVVDPAKGPFFVFTREAWGTVHVRTNGRRLLVWADSAKDGLKEPYAFEIANGTVSASNIVKV